MIVVIEYDDEDKAQEVKLTLLKLQQDDPIDMEDAVVTQTIGTVLHTLLSHEKEAKLQAALAKANTEVSD